MVHEAKEKGEPLLLFEGLEGNLFNSFQRLPLPYADEGDLVTPLGEISRPSLHVNALAVADKADLQ
jgi:hypothetical protein